MSDISSIHVRKLTADEVEFQLSVHEEQHVPILGNILASGDEELDKQVAAEAQARIDRGDIWAWCTVQVTAKWGTFTGKDVLGACSYKDEDDFKDDAYYADLKACALDNLQKNIEGIFIGLAPLMEVRTCAPETKT